MPLPDIQLDDRRFEDLVAELRRRIPAYTPEWTDFNESDPGIALIQLFAWLADILVYRINQIPDKAYVKFLQMIGVQLGLPTPAQTPAHLHADLQGSECRGAHSGRHTGRVGQRIGGSGDLPDHRQLVCHRASLAAVQTFDGARYTVVNNFNPTDGSSYPAFSAFPQAGAALYMGFDRAFPSGGYNYPLTILLQTASVGAAQGSSQSAQNSSPPVTGVLEYSTATGWQTVTIASDSTGAATQSGVISFQAPSGWTAECSMALCGRAPIRRSIGCAIASPRSWAPAIKLRRRSRTS